jgi:hypothetical protein
MEASKISGNKLIKYLYSLALYQEFAALRIPKPRIRESISSETLTVVVVPPQLYDLHTVDYCYNLGTVNFSRLDFAKGGWS